MMRESTSLGSPPPLRETDAVRLTEVVSQEPERETYTKRLGRFALLPPEIERLRGQKNCSYCKHSIDEDPYFLLHGYWQRFFQNKSYLLRYGTLELAQWIAGVFYFVPKFKAYMLGLKTRILLPGWVRCANPDCGQLYHATCWYQLHKNKGCLRCRSYDANRVVMGRFS